MKKKKSNVERTIAFIAVISVLGVIAYFFIASETAAPGEIPTYVTGDMREIYDWAKTPDGWNLLEQLPCYCGCKYEGHLHTRHCFWRDDNTFDKHGLTCSVCFDIAKKAKQMHESGSGVCEIRKEIDGFYAPNKHLGTETPMPENCS